MPAGFDLSFMQRPRGSQSVGVVDDIIREFKERFVGLATREFNFDIPNPGDSDEAEVLAAQLTLRQGASKVLTPLSEPVPSTYNDVALAAGDEGRKCLAYHPLLGLVEHTWIWREELSAGLWLPVVPAPLGAVMWLNMAPSAFVDGLSTTDQLDASISLPGWYKCWQVITYDISGNQTNQSYVVNVPDVDFGGGRVKVMGSRTIPNLADGYVKGSDDNGAAGYGGSHTPKLTLQSLIYHRHGLTQGSNVAQNLVVTKDLSRITASGGAGRASGVLNTVSNLEYDAGTLTITGVTDAAGHSPSTADPGDGTVGDNAQDPLAERFHRKGVYIIKLW